MQRSRTGIVLAGALGDDGDLVAFAVLFVDRDIDARSPLTPGLITGCARVSARDHMADIELDRVDAPRSRCSFRLPAVEDGRRLEESDGGLRRRLHAIGVCEVDGGGEPEQAISQGADAFPPARGEPARPWRVRELRLWSRARWGPGCVVGARDRLLDPLLRPATRHVRAFAGA